VFLYKRLPGKTGVYRGRFEQKWRGLELGWRRRRRRRRRWWCLGYRVVLHSVRGHADETADDGVDLTGKMKGQH